MEDGAPMMVEIDGTGVSPGTVDAVSALELAAAFFRTVAAIAADRQTPLELRGLRVLDKCASIEVYAAPANVAHECARDAERYVRQSGPAPHGVRGVVERLRAAVRGIGPGHTARVMIDGWVADLNASAVAARPMDGMLTVRARVLRVGGKRPAATFESDLEEAPFTLSMSRENAAALAHHLYRDVDIEALVSRDLEGRISEGDLERFDPVDAIADERALWRAWLVEVAGDEWESIDDIESELGRDGH